jgi:hypothetical protein
VTQVTDELWLCCFYTSPHTFNQFKPSLRPHHHIHLSLIEAQLQRSGIKFVSKKGFQITVESSSSSSGGGQPESWSCSHDSNESGTEGHMTASIFQVYDPSSLELLLALPQEHFETLLGPPHEIHEVEGLVFGKSFLRKRCHPEDLPHLLDSVSAHQRTQVTEVSKPEDLGYVQGYNYADSFLFVSLASLL